MKNKKEDEKKKKEKKKKRKKKKGGGGGGTFTLKTKPTYVYCSNGKKKWSKRK